MFTGASTDMMVTRDDSLLRDAEGASLVGVGGEASNAHPLSLNPSFILRAARTLKKS